MTTFEQRAGWRQRIEDLTYSDAEVAEWCLELMAEREGWAARVAHLEARLARSVRRDEVIRALRAADVPEDSMATDEDLVRYEGRAEAVDIVREMLGWNEWHWDAMNAEHHHGTPGECDIPTCSTPRPRGVDDGDL